MTKQEFLQMVLPCLGRLTRFARRLCGDADQADDLVQETLIQALKARDQLRTPAHVLHWMLKIMRRRYLDERRGGQRRLELLESEQVMLGESIGNLEDDILHSAISDEVEAALAELPEDMRISVLLSDVEGLTYDEIAEVLECPLGTIASRLARARARLLKRLSRFAQDQGIGRSKDK